MTGRDAAERARFYDARMQAVDRGDVPFYRERARDADGPVLELACGTGRVSLELLRHGLDVDGFDVSDAALDVLRRNADDMDLEPSVWRADVTDFAVDREYALAICPFNAMQNLLTIDDQVSALRCIHDALEPGGRFVFDVFVPSFDVICETYGEWTSEEIEYRDETHTYRSRTRIVDEVEQQYLTEAELIDPAGERVFASTQRLTLLPKREVELVARLSPFSEWRVTGDFTADPLRDGDSIQTWTLEK